MARVTLEKSVKFKALVRRLGIAKPFVRGLLETMWDVAHECGNPVLGSEEDVETAAEWPARGRYKRGSLFAALKDGRWVEEGSDGRWFIHDYWHHAPAYVKDRRRKEESRSSSETHHVSRSQNRSDVSLENKDLREESPGHSGTCLKKSATPAPAPAPINTPIPPEGVSDAPAETQEHRSPKRDAAEFSPGFVRFWAAYPSHERKVGKSQCARLWKRKNLEAITGKVIAALERCKASRDWAKNGGEFVPGPQPWLNKTPWETDAAEMVVESVDLENGFQAVRPEKGVVAELLRNRRGGV